MAITSRPLAVRTHQRKHSSSKTPSSPSDEPRAIATPAEAPTTEAKPIAKVDAEKRSNTRLSRRKSKETTQEAFGRMKPGAQPNLPSVPSTQHLDPAGIHLASLFSAHRPISITAPIPPPSSETAFSLIFNPRKQHKPHPTDVIYTISSTLENLEAAAQPTSPQYQQQQEQTDLRTAVTQASHSNAEIKHLDAQPPNHLHINIQELARNFRPYVAPPPPVAMGSPEEVAQLAKRKNHAGSAKKKSYSALLTILESTAPNGQKIYEAHTSPIREDSVTTTDLIQEPESPNAPRQRPQIRQPFLNRMRIRQEVWEDSPRRNRVSEQWRAISVKRQRKLKMKKHKYKKLMRRTRNLRRRLDRN